jgi:hypothetical protein
MRHTFALVRSGIFAPVHSKKLFPLLILAFASGCALFGKAEKPVKASPYMPIAGVLDEEYLHSPSGDIAAHYPKGWLHVDIRTIPMQNVQEVYTDQERSRALVLAEIPATAEFRRNLERDGIAAIADQSFASKSAKLPGKLVITHPTELYSVNGKLVASYQYGDAGVDSTQRKENRIVLFTTGAKFYELGMIELEKPQSLSDHIQNFRILESVVASLEGVAEVRQDTLSSP